MTKFSKHEIIAGIIICNRKIYEYLDAKYRSFVIHHVLNNSGTKEDGEELYQDVIFEIYLNIEHKKYDASGKGTFEGYFNTIVRTRWIDRLRKRKIKLEGLEAARELADTPVGALKEDDFLMKQILEIRKVMERLSNEEQMYIQLYYFAQKSLQFIADYFETTYDYARLKLHRIREKIKTMIENDPEFGTSVV